MHVLHKREKMIKLHWTVLSAVALTLTGTRAAWAQNADCRDFFPPILPTKDPGPGLNFPTPSSKLPFDVTFGADLEKEHKQQAFDLFSWASFIALNWPAGGSGEPIGKSLGDEPNAARVWETFISAPQVFKKHGAAPDPWGTESSVDKALNPELRKGQRLLVSPTKNVLAEYLQAGFQGAEFPPIADVNGNYVLYEIRLNKVSYEYIITNNLYNQAGQTAFLGRPAAPNTVEFPMGSNATSTRGSVEIKAMWKQIGCGDDPKKFYTIQAIRIDPVTKKPSPCPILFGLVGLHIVTRTTNAPKWIWSTFEHKDNAPDVGSRPSQSHYSFFVPSKQLPASGFGFKPPDCKPVCNPTTPTQIARVLNNNLINAPWTQNLNAQMQARLAGTVWANYRLVSTQWLDLTDGRFIPCQLTNTVAETYFQNDPRAGSCIRCHDAARTAGTDLHGQKGLANLSYLLRMAQ
jgi:hypothetical protein